MVYPQLPMVHFLFRHDYTYAVKWSFRKDRQRLGDWEPSMKEHKLKFAQSLSRDLHLFTLFLPLFTFSYIDLP